MGTVVQLRAGAPARVPPPASSLSSFVYATLDESGRSIVLELEDGGPLELQPSAARSLAARLLDLARAADPSGEV